MKIFGIKEPIFHMGVQFYWDCTKEEFFNAIEDDKSAVDRMMQQCKTSVGLTATDTNGSIPCIWISDINNLGVVVHECLHATHNILKSRGFELSDETEEVYAYYQEFLFHAYQEGVLGMVNKIGVSFMQDGTDYKIGFNRDIVAKGTKLIAKGTKKQKPSKGTKVYTK